MKCRCNSESKVNFTIILCTISLIIVYLYHLDKANLLYILSDEFGYWADAAYFWGYDWSGVASQNSYYSFGYSIILLPLFNIKNFVIRYQVALATNIFFMIMSFFVLRSIANRIFENLNSYVAVLMAFCATLYSSNLYFSKTTLSESFLYFAYSCTVYLVVRICEESKSYHYILLGLTGAYIFSIHMRAIGITVSVVLFLLFEFIHNKERRFIVAVTLIEIFIILMFIFGLKNNIIYNLYHSNITIAENDFEGQIYKIKMLLDINGIVLLFKSAIGKMYYLFSSTFLLFAWALIWICIQINKALKNIKKREALSTANIYSLFLIVSFTFTFGISSLYMIGAYSNIDCLIYGRYNEFLIGQFILTGGCYLISNKSKVCLKYAVIITIYLLAAFCVIYIFREIENPSIREANIAGVAFLSYDGNSCLYNNWEIVITLKVILISIFIGFLITNRSNKWKIAAIILLSVIWTYGGCWLLNYQLHYRESYYTYKKLSDYLSENKISEITYLMNENYSSFDSLRPDILQYMYPELNISYKNIDDISLYDETIFFVKKYRFADGSFEGYECIATSNDFELYIRK